MEITDKLIKTMLRAIGGDATARQDIQPALDTLKREDEEAEARTKAEAEEAARLAEKRKRDKYELIPATRDPSGRTAGMQQIRALRAFGTVKAGELGGHIGCEANLSQTGDCWIYPGAIVEGDARVTENAQIHNGCNIVGRAQISGSARLYACNIRDDAMVSGATELRYTTVEGGACVTDEAKCYRASISGAAYLGGQAQLWGDFHEVKMAGGTLTGTCAIMEGAGDTIRPLMPGNELPVVVNERRRLELERQMQEQEAQLRAEAAARQEPTRQREKLLQDYFSAPPTNAPRNAVTLPALGRSPDSK